jgi:RimJ/RimL family protein N-acetyltransferase
MTEVLLATPRLVLRRFEAGDAPVLAAYRSDPDVARYQSWEAPVSLAAATDLVRSSAAGDPEAPGWFQYAVSLRSSPEPIGDVGVCLHGNGMQADIGFTLAPKYQGHGYATEAVQRVVEHLFRDRGLHRVSAECDARNVRSARLLERVGFRREGHRIANTWIKGEWTDEFLFGLLAADWFSSRPGLAGPAGPAG